MVRKKLSVISYQLPVKPLVLFLLLLSTQNCLLRTSFAAQQPQTSDVSNAQPLFSANAKYVQGVGPGYWPTAGNGRTLNLSAGTAVCGNSVPQQRVSTAYPGGSLTLTASSTNYVYLSPVGPVPPMTVSYSVSGTGGSLAAGTYLIVVTYTNPVGESFVNWFSETAVTTSGASSKIIITSPPASLNATGWNAYVTAVNGASGSETKQNASPVAMGTNLTVTSITSGAAVPIVDTSACAPWFNTTGFATGQLPIATVVTGGSSITSITDVRNWFNGAGPADTGSQVFSVTAYGAKGDGTTDDTAAIQNAITAAINYSTGMVYFPPGAYVVKSTLTTGPDIEFRGAGIASVLEPEFSGDVINVTGVGFKMQDMAIHVSYPSGSRGTSAIIIANAPMGWVRDVYVSGQSGVNNGVFFRAQGSTGNTGMGDWWFDSIFFPYIPSSGLWQDYFLITNSSTNSTLASFFFTNVVGSALVADAGWDLNGALDTVYFTQCGAEPIGSGSTGPSIWIQNTLSSQTEFPRWVECFHCTLESPGRTSLQIDAGKNISYSGYISSATTGVAVGSAAIETDIHDTLFAAILQSAITYTGTGGLQVHHNQFDSTGQQTNNTYDTISVANSAGNFQIVDNYWRNSTYFGSNIPRYGINVGTGATDYVIARNRFQNATFGTAFLYDQTSAGHGGFFGSVINAGSTGSTTAALSSANQVRVIEFTLPDQRLINKVVSEVTTNYSGGYYSVGLYNQPGTTKLVDSGKILTTTAQVNSVTLSSPVTLPPGVYWLAWCGDNTTFLLRAFTTGQSAAYNMMTKNVGRNGVAANACSSGALPSSLGTITGAALDAPAVWFEP